MQPRLKLCTVDSSKAIDKERGIISFVLTKRMVDRDSEVIEPIGAKLDNFLKNPVFLWAHDLHQPSIGRVIPETLTKTSEQLTGEVQFDLDDPFARLIFNKFVKGYLNAGSIRFIPVTISDEPVLEGQRGKTIKEWELLEFSAVPVPANQGALAIKDFKAGLTQTDRGKIWLEELKSFFDDDTFDHTPEGWLDRIEMSGDKKEDADAQDEPFDPQKPYPSEHACRLKDPDQFVRFRRQQRDHEGKKYWAIIGFKRDGGSEDQAYRYPKDTWSEAQARAHCKDHNGIAFEPASGERSLNICSQNIDQGVIEINNVKFSIPALNSLTNDLYSFSSHNSYEAEISSEYDKNTSYNSTVLGYWMIDATGQWIWVPFSKLASDVYINININQPEGESKAGRVLSSKNRRLVEAAIEALQALLTAADESGQEEAFELADVNKEFNEDESKLPDSAFALVVDGKRYFAHHEQGGAVVWKACAKAMIEVFKNTENLLPEQIKSAYEHLAKHYRQFDKEPPELELINAENIDANFLQKYGERLIEEIVKQLKEF